MKLAKGRITALLVIAFALILFCGSCIALPAEPPLQPSPSPSPPPEPPPQSPMPIIVGGTPQSNGEIARAYLWNYYGKEWALELSVSSALYQHYKGLPRPPTQDYSVYVTHPMDDTYINRLVEELGQTAQREGFTSLETVAFIAAFVQNLPYTDDAVTTPYDEYPRYPIETLVDNGGDCEDISILTASLLDALGYDVILLLFPGVHAAVGVNVTENVKGAYFQYNSAKFFYLETTNTGWELGQIPDEVKQMTAHIYNMTPVAILTHHWDGTVRGDIAELAVIVENLGSKTAEDVRILAGFDASEGRLWNAEESDALDLPASHSLTIELTMRVPQGKHTRIIVQLIFEGYAVDESYSEWFDT